MEKEIMTWGLGLVPYVAAGLAFLVVWMLYGTYQPQRIIVATYQEISGLLREKQKDSHYYRRMEQWLNRNGAAYHYGKKITPVKFFVVRIVLAVAGAWAFGRITIGGALAVGMLLYYLPCFLLLYLNKCDNEKLLPEIKLLYNALELQIRAGVYVTDALTECYGSVRDKRLKDALLDLAGDIVMRADMYRALEKFQGAFDNRYVDSLCITIIQAMESGQAVELLSDIGEQIRDMEQAVLERKKAALDRRITFYQLGILVVVFGIALYTAVIHMLDAAMLF